MIGQLLKYNMNIIKCKYMSNGPVSTTNSYTIMEPSNTKHSFSNTDCAKDLGIWISSTLSPSVHLT